MSYSFATAVYISQLLVGITLVLSSAELLRSRSMFSTAGLAPWTLYRTLHRRHSPLFEVVRDLVLDRGLPPLLIVRLVLAFTLLFPHLAGTFYGSVELMLIALNMIISYRGGFGGDGSEQMSTLVLVGLSVTQLAPGLHLWSVPLGIAFIAVQVSLSYFVAGIAKLISPVWRNGEAIRGILHSSTYGFPSIAEYVDRVPGASLAICWTLMIFETSFPLCLFGPRDVLIGYLIAGLLFHLGNSVLMGLNTFLPAFAAGYPALSIVRHMLR